MQCIIKVCSAREQDKDTDFRIKRSWQLGKHGWHGPRLTLLPGRLGIYYPYSLGFRPVHKESPRISKVDQTMPVRVWYGCLVY